jgi:hypothetical protein
VSISELQQDGRSLNSSKMVVIKFCRSYVDTYDSSSLGLAKSKNTMTNGLTHNTLL